MEKTKYLEVNPRQVSEKDKVIKLSEVTSVIKTFVVKNPFLFLTGGIVNRKKTKGDFDILYRAEYLPDRMLQEIKEGLMSGLDDNLKSRSHLMMDAYHGPFTSNVPLGKLQVTKVEEKSERKSYIPVGSSGVEIGEDIYLDDILKGLSSFVFKEKFLWLVGELPAKGETDKYIDFVFCYPKLPLSLSVALKFRLWRALPKEYWHRIRYKFDPNFKPADTDICFGKLEFILNERLNTVEMSLKNLISKQRAASPEIRAQAKASAEEDKVKLFRFYLPLKPIRGYFPRERQTIDLFVSIVTDESKGPWYSTKKYDGANVEIHYDKGKAKIISEDGEDNTDRFPKLIEELKKLGADNFSLVAEIELWKTVDGELKHQPREAVIGRIHRKGDPDETGLVANVYDLTYLNGKDIHNEPFEKRLQALKTLKFPQATWRKPNLKYKLNRAPAVLSKTVEDIRKHTQFLRKLNGSEGNVIKLSTAKYRLDGKRSNQCKFHNSGVANVIVIEAIETKVENIWNYLFGLDPQDKKVPEKLLVEIGGKKYLKVGKTFSSARPMKKGDVFILEYETLNLERNEKTDEIKVTAWSPRELGKTDKKVDSIDSAVRKAKAGLVFQEKIIPVEGEIIYKVEITSDLEKQVLLYKEVPPEDKGPYQYVCHHHYRGKSCHTDLRIVTKRGEYAIGFTIDDLIKGAIKEPVITMKEARRVEKEGKAFKINWETGKFVLRRTAAGQVKPTELRAHEKARIPIEWMEVQGVAPIGTVGATKEYPGVFIIVDKGKAQYLAQKTYYHEYWMDGTLKGRLVFRRLEQKAFESLVEKGILPEYILNSFNASLAYVNKELNPVEAKYVPLVKDGSIVFEKSDLEKIILPPSEIPEGAPRVGVFWVAIQPIVQVPYVISRRAVNKKWVPPKGFSALPLDLKKKVPEEFKYWTKTSTSERRKIRDDYFEYLKKEKKEQKNEVITECPEVVVEERIHKEEVWICPHCKKEIGEKELYHDIKEDKDYHRPCFDKGPIKLPKDDRVLCSNCLKIVDYLGEPEVCMGAIKCPYCGATIDQTGKVLVEPEKKVGTFPFSLHWHWWRGPIVVRRGPSAQHWDVRIDNGELPFPHFQCTENPVVIDKTTCVYKPCKVREALEWNGSIAPAGVTKELVEVTVIEKVDETAEGQIYTVKDKKGEIHTSKPVRFPRLKKGDKVWMDYLERLWTIVNPDANPTKNTPAYTVLIDDGKAEVLEDSDLFKKVRFKGKNLKGLYTFIREDPKTDIWVMAKSGLPGEPK